MSESLNLIRPVLGLIGLVDAATISGPDDQGIVWLTRNASGENPVSISLGHVGTPAAEAGIRWRLESESRAQA